MEFSSQSAISYYTEIAVINKPHKVYLAQHRETGKIYIKKILDVYNINVFTSLKNTPLHGIPRIVEFCEEDSALHLIEEFINGESLSDLIEQGLLTRELLVRYMLDVCSTVERLHAMTPPIIHRDIKPSNIIIDRYNRAILMDFNAAKHYDGSHASDTVLLGTEGYAAPEQYGFASSSPQTDIYALGILLKEMLQSLTEHDPVFDPIISKCTQMNPNDRYLSVSELKRAVLAASKNEVPASEAAHSFLPPGFRTRTPWKMAVATVSYALILWMCLNLKLENTYGAALWISRFFYFAMAISVVCGCFNYLDIHRFFPLCRHPERHNRYLGILLLDLFFMFVIILLMTVVLNLLSSIGILS